MSSNQIQNKQIYQEDPVLFTNIEDLTKYKRTQKIKFICSQCGLEDTKYRINIKLPLLCKKCVRSNTYKNYDWSARNKKTQQTKLERYGNPYYCNSQKIAESLQNRTDEQKEKTKQKIKETCIKKYGCHPAARSEQIERTKQTCLEKYGVEISSQSQQAKDSYKQTCIKKYGVDNVFKSEEIKQKIKKTCLARYGVDNPRKSKLIDVKIKESCLEKYGVEHPWSCNEVRKKCFQRYLYDNIHFDSSWELYYYIYLTDNNIEFEYQPNISFTYNNNKYFPDFKIGNNLYEIKGEHFFDTNGNMINPYDETQNDLYEAKHQCMLKNNVIILRKTDLEHVFEYVDNKYTKDFIKLFKIDLPFPEYNINPTTDMKCIKYFHKSIYSAHRVNCLSPLEAWNDKNIIKKVALNRLKYVGSCTVDDILYGMNVSKIAPKVSVFSPILAKQLIEKYLTDFNIIFDPFSGFSGRMLGTVSLNKQYIGRDINETHINETLEIIKYKNIQNVDIKQQDIITASEETYEALFTCPPYGNIEVWVNHENDITKTCDEWIDICLSKYKCKKYLFVVNNTKKYKDNIVDVIENTSHFNKNLEYIVLI